MSIDTSEREFERERKKENTRAREREVINGFMH